MIFFESGARDDGGDDHRADGDDGGDDRDDRDDESCDGGDSCSDDGGDSCIHEPCDGDGSCIDGDCLQQQKKPSEPSSVANAPEVPG